MSRKFSFYLLLAIALGTGFVFFQVMARFVIPLFLAAVLVVIFRPVQRWISARCQGRERIAAALTTGAIMLIVIAPLVWIFALATTEGIHLVTQTPLSAVKTKLEGIRKNADLDLEDADLLRQVEREVNQLAQIVESQQDSDTPHVDLQLLLEGVKQLSTLPADQRNDSGEETGSGAAANTAQALQKTRQDLIETVAAMIPLQESDPNGEEFSTHAVNLQFAFHRYRNLFLGGAFRAWLKDAVNPSDKQFRDFQQKVFTEARKMLLSVTGTGAAIVSGLMFNLTIMIIAVYYFLADGPKLIRAGMRLSPLDDRYEAELLNEFDVSCRAVVLATLLTAVAQGILSAIGYYFCGLGSVFLLTMLTMVFALVPFVGAATIWVPASLWLLIDGHPYLACILFTYGFFIVSMADNVVKPYVLHGQSNLHPLLALLSVIGGVQVLGPLGILVGPMVVTFLQALLNMLQKELDSMSEAPESIS